MSAEALAGEMPTRRRIIEAARTLFSERSWLGVTMADIAEQVGISKPALYHHFSGKGELYAVVMDDVSQDLRARIDEAAEAALPAERLHGVIRTYLQFGMSEKNLLNALTAALSPEDSQLRGRLASWRADLATQVRPVVEDVVAQRHPPAATESAVLTEMLLAMMDGLVLESSFLTRSVDPGAVADQMIRAFGLDRSGSGGDCVSKPRGPS